MQVTKGEAEPHSSCWREIRSSRFTDWGFAGKMRLQQLCQRSAAAD